MDLAAVSSRLAEKILPRQHSPRLAQELVVVLALPVPIRQQRSTVGCFTPGRSSSFPPTTRVCLDRILPWICPARSGGAVSPAAPPLPPPFRPFPDSGQAGEALDQAFLIKSVSLALFGCLFPSSLPSPSSSPHQPFPRSLAVSFLFHLDAPAVSSFLPRLASPCLANNTCSPARQVFWIFENASLLLASLIDSSDLKTSSFSTRPFIQPLSHSAIDRSIHYHACRAGYSFL